MSETPDSGKSVAERLRALEDEFDELDVETIGTRLQVIEDEQSQLRADLTQFVEALRDQGTETPHIDSVEALHDRIEQLEAELTSLRQLLDDVVDQSE